MIHDLEEALASGVLSTGMGANRVQFDHVDGMTKRLAWLKGKLAELTGGNAGPVFGRITHRRGH